MYDTFLKRYGVEQDSSKDIFHCLFQPPFNPSIFKQVEIPEGIANCVCEFFVKDGKMKYIRTRADKQYGNNVAVAYDNYASQENPLNIEDMFGLKNSYFAEKDSTYEHLRKYHRTIKF
jgi:hypothetical protein